MDSKIKKITVLLEQYEFERLEAYCSERCHKKSTLVARLIREHLDKENYQLGQMPLLPSSSTR